MKLYKVTLLLGAMGGLIGLAHGFFSGSIRGISGNFSPILIESRESKNQMGEPVYNLIQLVEQGDKDIWLMQQSHQGNTPSFHAWDKLAIVVNRDKKTARFYQLEPGQLEFSGKEIAFKVACYLCHSNGPRVIRPNFQSASAALSFQEKAKIFLWNLRIKSYGRLLPDKVHEQKSSGFRFLSAAANEPLRVKTCVLCHKESGFFARGELKRQHFLPIRFLVKEGHMPPLGLSLSEQEKQELERFAGGTAN